MVDICNCIGPMFDCSLLSNKPKIDGYFNRLEFVAQHRHRLTQHRDLSRQSAMPDHLVSIIQNLVLQRFRNWPHVPKQVIISSANDYNVYSQATHKISALQPRLLVPMLFLSCLQSTWRS
jgi:hypothetical protein